MFSKVVQIVTQKLQQFSFTSQVFKKLENSMINITIQTVVQALP